MSLPSSRKRALAHPSPRPLKRHLNANLASSLHSLHISPPVTTSTSSSGPFSLAPSPFLSTSASTAPSPDTALSFDPDFAASLQPRAPSPSPLPSSPTPPSEERRLVVYRPPVRTPPAVYARVNARMGGSRFVMRSRKLDEWVLSGRTAAKKRKLAVVPWTGGKRLCDTGVGVWGGGVIRMGWKEEDKDEQDMQIEEMR